MTCQVLEKKCSCICTSCCAYLKISLARTRRHVSCIYSFSEKLFFYNHSRELERHKLKTGLNDRTVAIGLRLLVYPISCGGSFCPWLVAAPETSPLRWLTLKEDHICHPAASRAASIDEIEAPCTPGQPLTLKQKWFFEKSYLTISKSQKVLSAEYCMQFYLPTCYQIFCWRLFSQDLNIAKSQYWPSSIPTSWFWHQSSRVI